MWICFGVLSLHPITQYVIGMETAGFHYHESSNWVFPLMAFGVLGITLVKSPIQSHAANITSFVVTLYVHYLLHISVFNDCQRYPLAASCIAFIFGGIFFFSQRWLLAYLLLFMFVTNIYLFGMSLDLGISKAGLLLGQFFVCILTYILMSSRLNTLQKYQESLDAIEQQKQELQGILDSFDAMVSYKDSQNRYIKVNKGFAEFMDIELESFKPFSLYEVFGVNNETKRFHEEDLEIIKSKKEQLNIIEQIVKPDGSIRWVRSDKRPYFDKGGKSIGVVIYSTDISLQVEAEQQLRESEKKFRLMFEKSPIAMVISTPENIVRNINEAAVGLWGYLEEEVKDLHTNVFYKTPNPLEGSPEFKQISENGGVYFNALREFRKKNGDVFLGNVTVLIIRDKSGKAESVLGMVEDVTQKHSAEQKLRESEMRFRLMFEKSPLPMIISTPDNIIQMANESALNLWGLDWKEMEYEHTNILFEKPLPVEGTIEFRKVLNEGGSFFHALRNYKKKNGDVFLGEVTVLVLRGPDENPESILGIIQDVTERERAEQKLKNINQELEEFAFVVSHDLREPLRTINSYAGLLDRRYSDQISGEAKEFLSFITGAARRMDSFIIALLEYSRSGRLMPNDEFVSVGNVLDILLLELKPLIEETRTTISYGELPSVWANEIQMRAVFQNLVTNAIKYRSPDRDPVIEVSCKPDGDNWLFEIKDNGKGIAANELENIFKVFYKLDGQDVSQGAGIGLSICKKIIQNNGGRIWAHSVDKSGTTFYFLLPMVKKSN